MTTWFQKRPRIARTESSPGVARPSRMTGLWAKCEECGEIIYRQELLQKLNVCPSCDHHMALPARTRIATTFDAGTFEEIATNIESLDPIEFSDSKRYRDRVKASQKATGEKDAFICGKARLGGRTVVVGCFVFEFMGGSMGSVVGEKVTRAFELATELECPIVVFSASGGARMQEGILSLMQMAKTSAAIAHYRHVRKPYVSVLLHPTTGGVAASFSWLGDVVLAEPKALIGFAGPRVIEQTIRQKLPEGFQRSEFLLDHGMVDAIVHRRDLPAKLKQLLSLLS